MQPVGRSPPRTMAVASVGGLEGRGEVNAVAWRGAGQADCESNVSRCTANSSLELRVRTVSYRNSNLTMAHLPMAEASTTLACLKGLKSSLMCTMVAFLIGIPKNGFGFEDSVGFGFGDWLAADGPLVVAGETLCNRKRSGIRRTNLDVIRGRAYGGENNCLRVGFE